jgi:hypothetical protein
MALAVSRPPLTAEARTLSQVSPCDICGRQHSTETVSFSAYFEFPLSVLFAQFSIPIFTYTLLLSEGLTDEPWKPSKTNR